MVVNEFDTSGRAVLTDDSNSVQICLIDCRALHTDSSMERCHTSISRDCRGRFNYWICFGNMLHGDGLDCGHQLPLVPALFKEELARRTFTSRRYKARVVKPYGCSKDVN